MASLPPHQGQVHLLEAIPNASMTQGEAVSGQTHLLTCYADASVEAGSHVGLAELAAQHVRVAHITVGGPLGRLRECRRPLLLRGVLAVCLLHWPACRREGVSRHTYP